MNRSAWCVVFTMVAACAAEPADDPAGVLDHELGGDAIAVRDAGSWYEYACGYSCWREQSFWVDLDVRDDAYDKRVGIVWTDDAWATHHVAYAAYERELGGDREQWGVDVQVGYFTGPFDELEVEYAAFVEIDGVTTWDPANNHHVVTRVTPERPVKLVSSEVSYEPEVGGVLAGVVRVYNLAYDKQVTIVYTTDGWATAAEAEATWWRENDWRFRIEGLGDEVLPDTVELAIRYRVAGREHWDNNDGFDYVHRMAPQLSLSAGWWPAGEPVSGIIDLYGSAYSDLRVVRVDLRIDDEPWRLGDEGLQWRQLELSTLGLADGEHRIELRAVLEGGYVSQVVSQTFVVENRMTPLGAWDPDFGALEPDDVPWQGWSNGLAVDGAGRVYLQWQEPWTTDALPFAGVVRFGAFGTDLPPLAYEEPPARDDYVHQNLTRLAIDGAGRVHAARPSYPAAIWRWTEGGAVDEAFGDGGVVVFDEEVGGVYVDAIGEIVAAGEELWVVARCPSFVGCHTVAARLAGDGAITAAVAIDPIEATGWDHGLPVAAAAGDLLYVQAQGRLFTIGAGPDGGAAVIETVVLDEDVHAPLQDLVRSPDGIFFGLDSGGHLVAFDAGGDRLAHWLLYSDTLLPGGARSPGQLAVLPDGDVLVLDQSDARVLRFDGTLAAP